MLTRFLFLCVCFKKRPHCVDHELEFPFKITQIQNKLNVGREKINIPVCGLFQTKILGTIYTPHSVPLDIYKTEFEKWRKSWIRLSNPGLTRSDGILY